MRGRGGGKGERIGEEVEVMEEIEEGEEGAEEVEAEGRRWRRK